ncbi:FAD-dependent oxidoreductase [Allorhizobium sp. BGMRC 0089]|uniref:FAD-dependent monooxygenase n=1 Tax=Allorhizobium sonneratiae TaxID=2934936 RepID=UPI002033FD61|nr:FAD-dependent monooxygenase [Allorhizobium sonneratiae]MCM2292224.1 FAD-dependent oxidoreductase [Allorhizobium sonneratiae]
MQTSRVAIVGGGIAGLCTALSCAHHGISSTVYEKSPQLEEVGAGLQLSPNATAILKELGVLDSISRNWLEPQTVALASGTTLKTLASIPVESHARSRWGAPYAVLHRATLQQALLNAVLTNPLIRLVLGQRVESPDAQILRDEPSGERPPLLIAADGVWSRLRNYVSGGPDVVFTGNIAWRFTMPCSAAPDFIDCSRVTAYLGSSAHMVVYPLKEMDSINIVAIAAGVDPGEGWAARSDESQQSLFAKAFSSWNPEIRALLDARTATATFWPLFEAGVGRWHNERDLLLIGDAAHAMMPFSAQGAAMAIEDAYELGNLVARLPVPEVLVRFEAIRQERIRKVRHRGVLNKFAYHAQGPVRLGRDMVLSLRSGDSFARDLDWLYGYRASA